MTKKEIWDEIQFIIEHQLFDLIPLEPPSEEKDSANGRADEAVKEIKQLLKREGWILTKK